MAVLSGMLLLSACSQSGDREGDGQPEITLGASMLSMQNEFVVNVRDAMATEAEQQGVTLLVNDAQRSALTQLEHVERFISQGVDAIILNPVEVEASSPAVDLARRSGIPIINVNSETRSEPTAFVGSDDVRAGEMAMEFIAESLGGSGNVLMLQGYMGQAAQIKREQGAQNVLEQTPGLTLLASQTAEWDRAEAMSLMENWIQSYGDDIDAVFAHNDEMGLGALEALENAGLSEDVIIISIDGIRDALQAVRDGRLDATVFQDARGQGSTAVQTALKIIAEDSTYQEEVLIPFQTVTRENVDQFLQE
ncbi:sugar ABC transporter substrate-binding protein [Halalkalibaculum sp. DA3122]|uniref:sugar ABC transporter substrate-binding protein n=1 Tax=unclassified Halalkalibaculum TaxID=2964617 RepID=UPI0037543577